MEIFKSFTFEAAHHLAANVPAGHNYSHVHGHSFAAEVAVTGEPDPDSGWIVDFAELDAAVAELRAKLDHRFLNDIEGLERPTLETISRWIWDHLKPRFPGLSRVTVRRGSCGEGCVYTGV